MPNTTPTFRQLGQVFSCIIFKQTMPNESSIDKSKKMDLFFWNSLSFAYLTLRWKMLAKGIFFFNSALIDCEPLMLALGMDQHILFSFWTFFLNCLISKLWSPKYNGIIFVFLFSVSNCKHWTCYFSNLQLSIKRCLRLCSYELSIYQIRI